MCKEKKFESEYVLHKFTEKNLEELFGLCYIESEVQCKNLIDEKLRMDTLAFDKKTNSFVIIEYKNELNEKVINQAQDYCDLVKNDPEGFVECFSQPWYKCKENLKKEKISIDDINYENTRAIIIGPEFPDEIDNPNNFEIWKITLCDESNGEDETQNDEEDECENLCEKCEKEDELQYNGKVVYKKLYDEYGNQDTDESKEIPVNLNDLKLTEQKSLKGIKKENCKLYCAFKNKVKSFFGDDVGLRFWVGFVSFIKNEQTVCIIYLKGRTKIHYLADDLEEFMKQAEKLKKEEEYETRDISDIEGYVGNYELILKSKDDLDYALELFKLIYEEK